MSATDPSDGTRLNAFARGDIQRVLAAFDDRIEWRQAEGNPYQPDGAPWIGKDTIMTKLFARIATEWDRFEATPKTFTPTADGVLVQGRYTDTYRSTGNRVDAQFAHVWQLRGGKATNFQQYLDTGQVQAALGGGSQLSAGAREACIEDAVEAFRPAAARREARLKPCAT